MSCSQPYSRPELMFGKQVAIGVPQFPLTLVPTEVLLELDRLVPHEDAKAKGLVVQVRTVLCIVLVLRK